MKGVCVYTRMRVHTHILIDNTQAHVPDFCTHDIIVYLNMTYTQNITY